MPNESNGSTNELRILWERLRNGIERPVVYDKIARIAWLGREQIRDDQQSNFYDSKYRTEYYQGKKRDLAQNHDAMKSLQPYRIERVMPFISKEDSVLEIGCSSGYFLETILPLCSSVTGIELNQEEAAYGRKRGLDIRDTTLEELGQSYEHICLFQVLEHQADPKEFLSQIRSRSMKGSGYLHIEVPTLQNPLVSLYYIPEFRDFWFQEPHKFYFTSQSLECMLVDLGFIICQIDLKLRSGLSNHFNWIHKRQRMADKLDCISSGIDIEFASDVQEHAESLLAEISETFSDLDERYKHKLEALGFGDTLFVTCQVL